MYFLKLESILNNDTDSYVGIGFFQDKFIRFFVKGDAFDFKGNYEQANVKSGAIRQGAFDFSLEVGMKNTVKVILFLMIVATILYLIDTYMKNM